MLGYKIYLSCEEILTHNSDVFEKMNTYCTRTLFWCNQYGNPVQNLLPCIHKPHKSHSYTIDCLYDHFLYVYQVTQEHRLIVHSPAIRSVPYFM